MQDDNLHIESMEVNLHANDQHLVMSYAQDLPVLLKDKVLPELDLFLKQQRLYSEDLKIDQLELDVPIQDLGQLELNDFFARELASKIAVQISSTLETQSNENQISPQSNLDKIGNTEIDQGLIKALVEEAIAQPSINHIHTWTSFLKHGYLTGNLTSNNSLVELEKIVFKECENAVVFEELMKFIFKNTNAFLRFLRLAKLPEWRILFEQHQNSNRVQKTFFNYNELVVFKSKLSSLKKDLTHNELHKELENFLQQKDSKILWMLQFKSLKEVLKQTNVKKELTQFLTTNEDYVTLDLLEQMEQSTGSNMALKTQLIQLFEALSPIISATKLPSLRKWLDNVENYLETFKITPDQIKQAVKNNTLKAKEKAKPSFKEKKQEPLQIHDEIELSNAGIVLLNPFLPTLFKNIGLLDEKGKWKSVLDQEKGAYLMNYVASQQWEAEEPDLFLNKIIVGLEPDYPISTWLEVVELWNDFEQNEIDQQLTDLLEAIRTNWKPMKNCTWNGLQADFLTRTGTINQIGSTLYNLKITPSGFDVLLPFKNWGISVLKYSWMDVIVEVEWK